MSRLFVFLIIGLFFGTGFGFLLAASTGSELKGHAHGEGAAHDHSAHNHANHSQPINVTGPIPTIALTLHPDGPQSRNLEITTTNFTFDPTRANGDHVDGRGHAHIYVNGVKLARIYGHWFHLDALPPGTHDIKVTLNANTHAHLAINGTPIEATATLVIE